jgi:hypothetical protein
MPSEKNQLFRKNPTREITLEVIKCFGLINFEDNHNFSRRDLLQFQTVDKIKNLKIELEKYYLPCKARTYLNDLNSKNVITILRQIVKQHGYVVYSREKYIRGDKFIIYQLVPSEQRFYRPVNIETNFNKQCIVRFD